MTTMYVTVPLYSDPSYSYSISLEGVSYILLFEYNERSQLYYLSLFDSDNNPIVTGEALVPSYPLFNNYCIPGFTGYFYLQCNAAINTESYKTYPDSIDQYYSMFYIFNQE